MQVFSRANSFLKLGLVLLVSFLVLVLYIYIWVIVMYRYYWCYVTPFFFPSSLHPTSHLPPPLFLFHIRLAYLLLRSVAQFLLRSLAQFLPHSNTSNMSYIKEVSTGDYPISVRALQLRRTNAEIFVYPLHFLPGVLLSFESWKCR